MHANELPIIDATADDAPERLTPEHRSRWGGVAALVAIAGLGYVAAGESAVPAMAELLVLGGAQPPHQAVDRSPVLGEADRDFLPDDHALEAALDELERAGDHVVVGDGHEIHAARSRLLVDFLGGRAALGAIDEAQCGDRRAVARPRVRVHVHAHQGGAFGLVDSRGSVHVRGVLTDHGDRFLAASVPLAVVRRVSRGYTPGEGSSLYDDTRVASCDGKSVNVCIRLD